MIMIKNDNKYSVNQLKSATCLLYVKILNYLIEMLWFPAYKIALYVAYVNGIFFKNAKLQIINVNDCNFGWDKYSIDC